MKLLPPITHPLHLVLGLAAWCLWFVAVYGGLSVACEIAPPAAERGALTGINAALALLTLATTLLLAALAWHGWRAGAGRRDGDGYLARLSAALYGFSAVGTLFVGLPIAALPPCL